MEQEISVEHENSALRWPDQVSEWVPCRDLVVVVKSKPRARFQLRKKC